MSVAVGPLGRNGEAIGSVNSSGKVAAMYAHLLPSTIPINNSDLNYTGTAIRKHEAYLVEFP